MQIYSLASCSILFIVSYSKADNIKKCNSASRADSKETYFQKNENVNTCLLEYNSISQTGSCVYNQFSMNKDVNDAVTDVKTTSLAVIPYDENNIPLHKKSVRHFFIAGHKFIIHQNWQQLGVAAVVWDAALVLAKYLNRNSTLVQGKKILELGAGTGLAGLVASALGGEVIVTERAEALAHLTSSIKENTQNRDWKISAQVLDWTEKLNPEAFSDVDVILGADIVYIEETFQDLLQTVSTLAPSSRVHILLSCRIRYDRDLTFFNMLREDFDVQEIFFDKDRDIRIFSVRRHL